MQRFETSTQNIFCQEAHRLLSRCILTLRTEVKTLSLKETMVEEIESILQRRTEGPNAGNVADPEVKGHLHDMGFLLAGMEDSLARIQLDVSEFAWVAGLVTARLIGLKPNQKGESKCEQNEQN